MNFHRNDKFLVINFHHNDNNNNIIFIQSDFSFRQTILPADILMYCTDIKVCSTSRRKQWNMLSRPFLD